ncbi:MAG: septum formation initiator family protein [Bacteroidales bacterium]|nr:septum formation initiator family protein [Bacteroidales bacterium]
MKKLLKIKGLKYWVATAVFVVVILFIDQNNLLVTMKLSHQVAELKEEEENLREAIVQDSINATTLKGNLDAIEHYGRENYYMKRANEDIYVIK